MLGSICSNVVQLLVLDLNSRALMRMAFEWKKLLKEPSEHYISWLESRTTKY